MAFLDETGLAYFWQQILARLNKFVQKEEGKGLSTNDLTNTLKSNYDAAYTYSTSTHAPTDAEKNVIVGIQKNGTDVSIDSNRKINITVPIKTSELTNDSGFISSTETVEANLVNNLTISYSATLTPANWTANGSNFVYNYSNTSLRAFVCPIITCTSNTNEYGYINDAEATSGSGIIFTATKKPTANIELIIIDMG